MPKKQLSLPLELSLAKVGRDLPGRDPLTGLVDRSQFRLQVEELLHGRRRPAKSFGLILLDLDHFRHLGETHEFHFTDRVIQAVADRLADVTRSRDLLGRVGGAEFGVLIPRVPDPLITRRVALRLQQAVETPLRVGEETLHLTAAMGLVMAPQDGEDADTLLMHALQALDRAKEEGRGTLSFFTPAFDARARERSRLERGLRHAIDHQELCLHYQPQVSLRDGRLRGVEALVRWNHPELGLLSPGLFVPIAEEVGLISHLGAWVIASACRQMRAWRDQGIAPERVAVNVSLGQFREGSAFVELVQGALQAADIPPASLELELTESMLSRRVDEARRTLEELAQLGVLLSLDDFGTGYSSFGHLRSFPIHKLKIDQTFVRTLGKDPRDGQIVHAMVFLGQVLGLGVVAEGVEHPDQALFLSKVGCDEVQGFLFGRPLPPEDLKPLLVQGKITPWDVRYGAAAMH